MTAKGKKLEGDVLKILKAYKLLQKEFDEREAQFKRALRLPDVEPQAGTGLHPMGGGAAKMKVVDQNRTRTIGLLAVVKDSMMRMRRELIKLVEVAEAGGTAAAGARDHVQDLQDAVADADRRGVLFQQLFAVAEVTDYVTEETAAEARAVEGACSWVQASINALRIEIDVVEAEADELRGKKSRRDVAQLEHLGSVAKAHKAHIAKLELLARLLVRGDVTPEAAEDVREPVCEYVAEIEQTRAGLGQFADAEQLEASCEAYSAIEQLQDREDEDDGAGGEEEGTVDGGSEGTGAGADAPPEKQPQPVQGGSREGRRASKEKATVAAAAAALAKPASPNAAEKQPLQRGGGRAERLPAAGAAPGASSRVEGAAFASAAAASVVPAPAVRQTPTPLPPAKWGNLNATLRMEAAAASAASGGAGGALGLPAAHAGGTALLPGGGAGSQGGGMHGHTSTPPADELPFDVDAARSLCWFSFGCTDEACAYLHIGLARCSNESADGSASCAWHSRRACRFLHADQERFIERDRSTIVRLRKGFPLEVGCTTDGGVRVMAPADPAGPPLQALAAPAFQGGLFAGGGDAAPFFGGLGLSDGRAGGSAPLGGLLSLLPGAGDSAMLPGRLLSFEDAATASGAPIPVSVLESQILAAGSAAALGAGTVGSGDDVGAALAEFERAATAAFAGFAAGGPAPAALDTLLPRGFASSPVAAAPRFPVELGLRDYARHLVSLFAQGVEARFEAAVGAAKAAKASWVLGLAAEQCWDEHQLLRCCNMHRQVPGFLADLAGRAPLDASFSPSDRRTLSDGLAFLYNVRTWLAHSELGAPAVPARTPFVISTPEALVAAAGVAVAAAAVLAAADAPALRASGLQALAGLVRLRAQARAHFASQALREAAGASLLAPSSLLLPGQQQQQQARGLLRRGGVGFELGDALGLPSLLSSVQLAEAPAQAFLRSNSAVYAWLRARHAITRSGVMLCPPLALADADIPFHDAATLMALATHGFIADT